MQGQRGGVGSLPETLNFDHGSSSSNAAVDQQICWNNMRDPSENRIPDYLLLQQSDLNITYVNAVSSEQQSLARWSIGEPSSSGAASEMSRDERKAELGWTSAAPCVGDLPRLEDRWFGPSNNFPPDNLTMNPMFIQGSNSDAVPPTLNLNSSYISHQDDSNHVTECPIIFKASGLENGGIPPTHGSNHFVSPPESGGLSLEGSDCRPSSSLEGRHLSFKRKAFEGSSVGGSSSYSQPTENSVIPARFSAGSNLVLSAPTDQANQRLRLGVREVISTELSDINVAETMENAHRNFRIRISSSNQSGSIYPNVPPSGSVRHSGISSSQEPNRLLPVNYSMNLRSAPTTDNATTQNPPFVLRVPALPRSVPSSRVSAGLNSRTSGSSGLVGNLHAMQSEDSSSRSMARIISENPLFAPGTDSRNSTRNPSSRRAVSGNLSIPVSVPPTSRTGSTMTTHSPSGPWLPPENPPAPQYPRRLSEIVRRQLFSSSGMESGGGQPSNLSSLHSGSSSAHGLHLSSRAGNQGHHALLPRAMAWIERQADGGIGIPYSLRALAAPSEGSGSNRLVSEIRNVLGLMRRGENLNIRLEDVMILDQSVLFGMADFHDRHRDMRLDVDNMSYEELLALEERIGNVSTGVSEETILSRLKRRKCSPYLGSPLDAEPCCICQEEYVEGEDVGKLECGHDYHTTCIKQWLMLKNLCPICKTTALPT